MSIPLPFASQYECRNETLEVYASDRRGLVEYSFNNYGYRNNINYQPNATGVGMYLGSSITSGIGVNWQDAFATKSSTELNVECYHFSQGCVAVDNQESLRMLTQLKSSYIQPKYWVIQFIDLNRRYHDGQVTRSENQQENLDLFLETFHTIQTILQSDVWVFTGSDASQCPVPNYIIKHPGCVGWNVPFVDLAGVGAHPGKKWHKMIAAGIVNRLQKQLN
jgi:hypothetical protein